jgi:hypothetical protein
MSKEAFREIMRDAPEPATDKQQQPALGAQLGAMWREGLKDLQNAILPAFPDSQRGVEEAGTPLNPTPQQVTKALGNVYSLREILEAPKVPPTPAIEREQERGREI